MNSREYGMLWSTIFEKQRRHHKICVTPKCGTCDLLQRDLDSISKAIKKAKEQERILKIQNLLIIVSTLIIVFVIVITLIGITL